MVFVRLISICTVADNDGLPCRATDPGWIGPTDKAGVEAGRGSGAKPPDSRNTGNRRGIGQLDNWASGIWISQQTAARSGQDFPQAVTKRDVVSSLPGLSLGGSGLCRWGACGK